MLAPVPGTPRKRSNARGHALVVAALGGFVLASWIPTDSRASTVAEQRARLPPPAACKDPVAGVWKSHSYDERHGDWTVFTLEIHRVTPGRDEFEGRITNHSWVAEAHESSPPACRGELRYMVSMDAKGTVQAGHINFWGIGTWSLDAVPCGHWNMGYNLDHFSGQIDPELLEFQTVNNDGGRAVNDPVVFRRVKCNDGEEPDPEPRIAVSPPAFYPPDDQSNGCGFR